MVGAWLCHHCGQENRSIDKTCIMCRKRKVKAETIDEGWVKEEVKKILDANKIWYFMPMAGRFGKKGIPDFVCCANGKFLAIETKANGNTVKDAQAGIHQKIRNAGGRVCVTDEHGLASLKITLSQI